MADYPLQKNVRLIGVQAVAGSHALQHSAGQWAYAFGRQMPFQGSPSFPIVGQVAQDVFSTDQAGYSYPAGQLWIRTVTDSTTFGDGYDQDTYWMAVPSTLPAGYTAIPWRNNIPSIGWTLRIGNAGYSTLSNFPYTDPLGDTSIANFASYTPQKCIRLAAGPYMPTSTTVDVVHGQDFPYGPGNLYTYVTTVQDGSRPDVPTPSDKYLPLAVGYRNARITVKLTNNDHTTGAGGNLYFRIDGTVTTVPVASLVFDGTYWSTTVDVGPAGMAAVGALKQVTLAVWRDLIFTWTWSGSFWRVDLSPRLDIPPPFNATTGNLVVPGGIAAGTVPGY